VGRSARCSVVKDWYNHDHHHSALGLMTPATIHSGQAQRVTDQRQHVLQVAYAAHPERFVRGEPYLPSQNPLVLPQSRPDFYQPPNNDGAAKVDNWGQSAYNNVAG
jgi:hypothetical protein